MIKIMVRIFYNQTMIILNHKIPFKYLYLVIFGNKTITIENNHN